MGLWRWGQAPKELFSLYTPETSAVDTEQFEFDDYELEADFHNGLAVLNMPDKAAAQEHYKNQILNEQTELSDGFPELGEHINWLTYDADAWPHDAEL